MPPRTPAGRPIQVRARQPVASEIKDSICDFICRHYYPGERVRFLKDQTFLLREVVLWPAKWFDTRGVTIPGQRYQDLMISSGKPPGILMDALRYGDPPKYPPAYLMACVQRHFDVHGESLYEEAKSVTWAIDRVISGLQSTATLAPPDPIRDLARAANLLRPRKRSVYAPETQLGFDL